MNDAFRRIRLTAIDRAGSTALDVGVDARSGRSERATAGASALQAAAAARRHAAGHSSSRSGTSCDAAGARADASGSGRRVGVSVKPAD